MRINNSVAKGTSGAKRLSQPTLTPMERRNKNTKIRRELSYPMDAHSKTEEDEREREIIVAQTGERRRRKQEDRIKKEKDQ